MNGRLLWLAALPLVAACAHAKSPVAEAPPAPPPAPMAMAAPAPAPPAERTCSADDQCSASELCLSSRCVAITAELPECRVSAHFDYDRSELHPADLAGLQRAARCLKALPQERTLLEGNCDARGTVQYNIALGFRRAHAVATYLEDLGTPAATLSEVSYGKELPTCTESTEACWAMNRRTDVDRGAEAKDIAARIRADERHERMARAGAAKSSAAQAQASAASRPAAQGRRPSRGQPAPMGATDTGK